MSTTAGFLNKAAKDYFDALTAIEAFEKAVRDVCKDVYDKYKTQLVSKMGLQEADFDDYDDKDPANGYADLGVKKPAQNGRKFYLYFRWDEIEGSEEKITACVSLDFLTNGDRDNVFKKLHRNPTCSIQRGDDGPYVWLRKKLSDPASFAGTLSELVKEWIACWSPGSPFK